MVSHLSFDGYEVNKNGSWEKKVLIGPPKKNDEVFDLSGKAKKIEAFAVASELPWAFGMWSNNDIGSLDILLQ